MSRRYKPLVDERITTPQQADRVARDHKQAIKQLQDDGRKLMAHAGKGLDAHADSHGDVTISFLSADLMGFFEDNYFQLAAGSGRGFVGSKTTADSTYDLPLKPRLRVGDRIKRISLYYRNASSEDITFYFLESSTHGARTTLNSEVDTGGGPSILTMTWGPDADGLPYTVTTGGLYLGVRLQQTGTLGESRFYMADVLYDRP